MLDTLQNEQAQVAEEEVCGESAQTGQEKDSGQVRTTSSQDEDLRVDS